MRQGTVLRAPDISQIAAATASSRVTMIEPAIRAARGGVASGRNARSGLRLGLMNCRSPAAPDVNPHARADRLCHCAADHPSLTMERTLLRSTLPTDVNGIDSTIRISLGYLVAARRLLAYA